MERYTGLFSGALVAHLPELRVACSGLRLQPSLQNRDSTQQESTRDNAMADRTDYASLHLSQTTFKNDVC